MSQSKRTSISISPALHKRIRIRCAHAGTKISAEVSAALNAYFAEEDEEPVRKPVKKKLAEASA